MKKVIALLVQRLSIKLGNDDPDEITIELNNAMTRVKRLTLELEKESQLRRWDRELAAQQLHQMRECCYCMVRNMVKFSIPRDWALDCSIEDDKTITNVELQTLWSRAEREVTLNHRANATLKLMEKFGVR